MINLCNLLHIFVRLNEINVHQFHCVSFASVFRLIVLREAKKPVESMELVGIQL